MKRLFLFVIFLPLLILTSCESDKDNITCADGFLFQGLKVIVLDASTGNPLTTGVIVTAKEGNYYETLMFVQNTASFVGAEERVGTYTVTVIKYGYHAYTSPPIVVKEGVCHVIPQSLTVNLQPN